jgi:hypothetical protein
MLLLYSLHQIKEVKVKSIPLLAVAIRVIRKIKM